MLHVRVMGSLDGHTVLDFYQSLILEDPLLFGIRLLMGVSENDGCV